MGIKKPAAVDLRGMTGILLVTMVLITATLTGCGFLPDEPAVVTEAITFEMTITAVPPATPTRSLTAAASIPEPQSWTAADPLIVSNPAGVWLRSEPSHLSVDANTVIIPYQSAVRVIGQPVYEADPGQWWWLVSAENGGIGWAEEASFSAAETSLPEVTLTPISARN